MSMRSPAPSLGKVEFLVLLWTTFAAFAALYGPQPLLPVIQQHFGVGSQSASLLMTLAILPLGLAPVCYGYILNLCSTRRLLQLTTALCALVLLAASFTTAFWQLLALRTVGIKAVGAHLQKKEPHSQPQADGTKQHRHGPWPSIPRPPCSGPSWAG